MAFDDVISVNGTVQIGSIEKDFVFTIKVKEAKGIDISKITADMIINWKDEYIIKNENNEDRTVKSEKLGNLHIDTIKEIIQNNLREIMFQKLAGIDKTKFDDIKNDNFIKLSDTEISNFLILALIIQQLIIFNIKNINEQNIIKFIANIEVENWDETSKQKIKDELEKEQTEEKPFLNLNDEEKKAETSKPGMSEEEIQQAINDRVKFANIILKINLDSIKAMYDLIIGTNKTIEIDLTDKQ